MIKKVLSAILLLAAVYVSGQSSPSPTIPVTAANIAYGASVLTSGTILFQAVDTTGKAISYQLGGGGQQITYPTVCAISQGKIAPNCLVANVDLTNPQNICMMATVKDAFNNIVLGGSIASGYGCLQPQTYNSGIPQSAWCQSGSCNFDQFVPNVAGVPISRLPLPTAQSLGGVYEATCPANQIQNGVLPTGYPNCVPAGSGASAQNLVGGAPGSIPYQSSPNNTSFLGLGTLGYCLTAGATTPIWEPSCGSGNITSVFGRTGIVSAQAGDYSVSQIIGAAPINSPSFTGTPTAPTQIPSDSSTAIATDAYVKSQGYITVAPVPSVFGRTGPITAQNGDYSVSQVTGAAPLASPALTGVPTAPTAAPGTNTFQLATTAFVVGQAGISNPLVDGTAAPGVSLYYARADHVHPTDTSRASSASPTFTGTVTLPDGTLINSGGFTFAEALNLPSGSQLAGTVFGPFATQVTPCARAQGCLNSTSAGTGILRDGLTPAASELSGDVTTSGSNAATVQGIKGVLIPALATGCLDYTGSAWTFASCSGGSQVYPSAGIAVSTNTAWNTSLGTGTNNVVPVVTGGAWTTSNAPALSAANFTGFPSTVCTTSSCSQNTTGTAAGVAGSYTANYFYASPNGASGALSPRAIVAADIPQLNQNTSGTAGNLSGTPALPNGTTATTQTAGDASGKLATDQFVANNFAPLASPALTGIPTAPTQASTDTSTAIATDAFVKAQGYGTGNVSTVPAVSFSQNIVQTYGTQTSTNDLANIRYVTASWNWSQTGFGSISAGSNTVTLSPCPLGIDTSANSLYLYKVYITGGVGVPEVALVTGGTCTPGLASGTIVFSNANSHSGTYTVGSSTSGIQEAWNDAWVNDLGAAPNASSLTAPYVKLVSNTQYNIYASVYMRGRGGVLDGKGALIVSFTRDRTIFVGTNPLAGTYHHLYNLSGTSTITVTGAQVSSVAASSGVYIVTTAAAHPFLAGDTVDCEYHTPNADQHWMSKVLSAGLTSTQFEVSLGSTTFASSSGFGFCNIENAFIEDNSDHVVIADLSLMQASPSGTGYFSYGVVNDNDQQLQIVRATNRGSSVILPNSGATFPATWPIGAYVYGRNDQGNDGITYIHDSEFSNINCGQAGGNGFVVENTVCQSFPMFGFRYFGGLQPITVSNVYQEASPGTANSLYSGTVAAQMGYLFQSGQPVRFIGTWPTQSETPVFASTGSTVVSYFVVPRSSALGYGPILFAGSATSSGSGNITVQWPSVELVNDLGSSLGTLTWDIIKTTGINTAAPNTSAGGIQVAANVSGSCSTGGICSFVDPQTSTTPYSVQTQQFTPVFWFWPVNYALNNTILVMDRVGTADAIVATQGITGVGVTALMCDGSVGTTQQRSPLEVQCPGGSTVDAGSIATIMRQIDAAGNGPAANDKGRLNFGRAVTAPNDIITLVDSNINKTESMFGQRPANDLNDIAVGIDQLGGFSERAPTSLSRYVGVIPSGTNFAERLTSASDVLNVPQDDLGLASAPSNPASGYCRRYYNTTTGLETWINSSGTSCGPASGGSGIVNPGTANQLGFYATNSSTISPNPRLTENGSILSYQGTIEANTLLVNGPFNLYTQTLPYTGSIPFAAVAGACNSSNCNGLGWSAGNLLQTSANAQPPMTLGFANSYRVDSVTVSGVADGQMGIGASGAISVGAAATTFTTNQTLKSGQWVNIDGAGVPATGTFTGGALSSGSYAAGGNLATSSSAGTGGGIPANTTVSLGVTAGYEANGPNGSAELLSESPLITASPFVAAITTGGSANNIVTITGPTGLPTGTTEWSLYAQYGSPLSPAKQWTYYAGGSPTVTTGCVSVTNGSPTVTWVPCLGNEGNPSSSFVTGSTWNGLQIQIAGAYYNVSAVGGAQTTLTLSTNYVGLTSINAPFSVVNSVMPGVIHQPVGMAIASWSSTSGNVATLTLTQPTMANLQRNFAVGQTVNIFSASVGGSHNTSINGTCTITAISGTPTTSISFNVGSNCGTATSLADSGTGGGSASASWELGCATVSSSGYGCKVTAGTGANAQLNNVYSDGWFPPMSNELLTLVTGFTPGSPATVTVRDTTFNASTLTNANIAFFTDNSQAINTFLGSSSCNSLGLSTNPSTQCILEFPAQKNCYGVAGPIDVHIPNVEFLFDGLGQEAAGVMPSSICGVGRFSELAVHGYATELSGFVGVNLGFQDITYATLCTSCEYTSAVSIAGNVPAALEMRNVQNALVTGFNALNFVNGVGFYGHGDGLNGGVEKTNFLNWFNCYSCAGGFYMPDNFFDNRLEIGQNLGIVGASPGQAGGLMNTASRFGVYLGNDPLTQKSSAGWFVGLGAIRNTTWHNVIFDAQAVQFHHMKGEQVSYSPAAGYWGVFDGITLCKLNRWDQGYDNNFSIGFWIQQNCANTAISEPSFGTTSQYIVDQGTLTSALAIPPQTAVPGTWWSDQYGQGFYAQQASTTNPAATGVIVDLSVYPKVGNASSSTVFPVGVSRGNPQSAASSIKVQTSGYITVQFDTATNAGDCNGTNCTVAVGDYVCVGTTTAYYGLPNGTTKCSAGQLLGKVAQAATSVTSGLVFLELGANNATSGASVGGTVVYTASQTASSSDNGKLVIMSCTSACAYTLPNPQPSSTFFVSIISTNTTLATVALGSSITYNGGASAPVLTKFNAITVNANSATATDYDGQPPLTAGNVTITPTASALTLNAPNNGGTAIYNASHTLTAADAGKLVVMSCSSACALTLPNPQPSTTFKVDVISTGTTLATVALGSSITYNGGSSAPNLLSFVETSIWANSSTSTDYDGSSTVTLSCTQATCATSTTTLLGSTTNAMYRVEISVACTASTSTATALITVRYTDPSGTAQSVAPTAAACTTLGTASVVSLVQMISVQNASAITYAATNTLSPSYQARIAIIQETAN